MSILDQFLMKNEVTVVTGAGGGLGSNLLRFWLLLRQRLSWLIRTSIQYKRLQKTFNNRAARQLLMNVMSLILRQFNN